MTHLTYIMASYGLAVLVAVVYSANAWMRMNHVPAVTLPKSQVPVRTIKSPIGAPEAPALLNV